MEDEILNAGGPVFEVPMGSRALKRRQPSTRPKKNQVFLRASTSNWRLFGPQLGETSALAPTSPLVQFRERVSCEVSSGNGVPQPRPWLRDCLRGCHPFPRRTVSRRCTGRDAHVGDQLGACRFRSEAGFPTGVGAGKGFPPSHLGVTTLPRLSQPVVKASRAYHGPLNGPH